MAYTKQNFTSGQVLKASHMNNIETAIVDNENAITALNSNMSNKANTDHTHDEYLTSIPSEYKTQTENDSLYQPIGDYVSANDIPTKTSQLTNDSGFISELPAIPTKTSELTNDSSFATENYVKNAISEAELSGGDVDPSSYVTKQVFYINEAGYVFDLNSKMTGVYYLGKAIKFSYNGVSTSNSYGYYDTFYFVRNDYSNMTDDTVIGVLTGKKETMSDNTIFNSIVTLTYKPSTNTVQYDTSSSRSYTLRDLAIKSEIPTKTSQLTNDSGFVDEDYVTNAINQALAQLTNQ